VSSDVTVVVPNFNGEDLLPRCLDAIRAQTVPAEDVVVVDNASADGSRELLAARHPEARVLALAANRGFGVAANLGVELARTTFVAVLNSDAEPAPDWLEQLLAAPRPADVWAWGSVLIHSGTGLVESAGDAYDRAGFAFKLAQGRAPHELPERCYEAFAPPGAAPLYRRRVFRELGGYDGRFFMYYEDVDLAFRAQLAGHRALMVPRARVRHDVGGSGFGPHSRRYIARNSLWCAVRCIPRLRLASLARSTARETRNAARDGYLAPYASGRLAAVATLPRALADRRRIQRARRVPLERVDAALDLRMPA
jgi:GT2 family glycosyltransferase